MHAFKIKKLQNIAKKLGFEELFKMKNIVQKLIISRRNNEDYYKSLRILEELAS